MRTLDQFVQQEILCCVSSLVSTLAKGCYGKCDTDLSDLMEQAFELSLPVEDWEEAATERGIEGPFRDKFGATYFEDTNDGATYSCGSWQEVCEAWDIEPYEREVFEHWVVTDWLADKLIDYGEKVDKDFAGLCVWARTTTNQSISMDWVIQKIYEDLMK